MPKPLATLTALAFALLTLALAAAQSQPPTPILQLSPAEHAAAIQQALEADQPDQAYLYARAWKRSAPGEIPPLTALASIYIAYGAPAAALESLESALALGPDPAETRRILALKIQTHATLGDYFSAWANARSYLRSAAPDDPFVSIISKLQWNARASFDLAAPYDAYQARIEANPVPENPFLLDSANIRANSLPITEHLYQAINEAYSVNDAAVAQASSNLTRFLLAAHYVGHPKFENGNLDPVYDYPDANYILRELTWGDAPNPIAQSLLQWARQNPRHDANQVASEYYEPESPEESPIPEIETFLENATPAWSKIQQRLPALLQTADQARTAEEIEAALRELVPLQSPQIAALERNAQYYADLLRLWQESQNLAAAESPLAAQLAQLRESLANDPLVAELQLRLQPALDDRSPDAATSAASLPRRLGNLIVAEFAASAALAKNAPRERVQASAAPSIADFDPLIAQDLMTPQLWAKRLAVAEQQGNWPESVWSAFQAYAGNTAAFENWLAPFVAEQKPILAASDTQIDQSIKALASGDETQKSQAFESLKTALETDPYHLEGLQALYQNFLERGQDDIAAQVLESLWRLSPSDFPVDDESLALAARAGNWPLLLSLADSRLARNEADPAAHLHRQIAAVALGFAAVAADSAPALDGTAYTHQARTLWSMAYSLKSQKHENFADKLTGLETTLEQIGIDHDDPVARLWLAIGFKFKSFLTMKPNGISWEILSANATPELQAHLDFIRGATPADTYLASTQGTAEEGTALFLHHFLALETNYTPANQNALRALADRQDLPLLFRAKAADALNTGRANPVVPLRPSDTFYTVWGTQNWDAVWTSLLPGQTLISLGEIKLPQNTDAVPLLRIGRLSRSPLVGIPDLSNYSCRLWEIDGALVQADNDDSHWQLEKGSVVAVSHSSIKGQSFKGHGSLWLEASDITGSFGNLDRLFQAGVNAYDTDIFTARHWEALQLRGDEINIRLGSTTEDLPTVHAFATDCLFLNNKDRLFTLYSPSQLHISDTRFYTQHPLGFATKQVTFAQQATFKNSHLAGAAQPDLTQAAGLALTELNLNGPADRTVSTYADLHQALGAAKPGQRIEVAPGRIVFGDAGPLQVPHGVVLRGSPDPKNPTILSVLPTSHTSPLIIVKNGDSWLENITLDTEQNTTTINGRKLNLKDGKPDRKAIVAKTDARPLLKNVTFADWLSASDKDRPGILSEAAQVAIQGKAPGRLQVTYDGRVDFLGETLTNGIHLSGTGSAFFPYASAAYQTISGTKLRFHGSAYYPTQLVYENGGGDARTLAWRALAEQNLQDTLAQMKAQLPARLDAAGSLDARIDIFRAAAQRLGPLARAAQANTQELSRAFAANLNAAMTSRPDEFPFYMEVFHLRSRAFSGSVWLAHAHSQTFAPAFRERYGSHLTALVGSQQRLTGELTSSDRSNLITFMRRYPVGSPNHARALAAFNRGESPSILENQINREEQQRRQREQYEAQLARQRQAEYERQRQAALNPPPAPKKSWWETYSSQYPSGRYQSSSNASKASASQNMSNYRRQLNDKIYNTGRDYGKQYQF